jgi:hypothetical protein
MRKMEENFEPIKITLPKEYDFFELKRRKENELDVREGYVEDMLYDENGKFLTTYIYRVYEKYYIIKKPDGTIEPSKELEELLNNQRKMIVTGETFPIKDYLKAKGFRFNGVYKEWERR